MNEQTTEQPTDDRSEYDEETEQQPEMALAPPTSVVEPPRPVTAAAPRRDPPLDRKREYLTVRVGHDGYAEVDGKRQYVSKNLAGATVNVERPY